MLVAVITVLMLLVCLPTTAHASRGLACFCARPSAQSTRRVLRPRNQDVLRYGEERLTRRVLIEYFSRFDKQRDYPQGSILEDAPPHKDIISLVAIAMKIPAIPH